MAEGGGATLWLVPNTLDHGTAEVPIDDVVPRGVLQVAARLAHWVVEDARSARAFLKRVHAVVPLALPLQAIDVRELPRPRKGTGVAADDTAAARDCLAPALAGNDVGLLSEAGLPGVADPGAQVVAAAHRLGVRVRPLAGASALMLALAASGLDGQHFAFVGYLPQEAAAREARLRELEATSRRSAQTQLIIETPYRNQALLEAMLRCLAPSTRLSLSCGLTLADGWSRSATVADWRAAPPTLPARVPAVFALLA